MIEKSKFLTIKKKQVINYIFDFLDFLDIFLIRNLDKFIRNIIDKNQKIFLNYLNLKMELNKKNIKTIEDLAKKDYLVNELYEDQLIFNKIFDNLFKNDAYIFHFDKLEETFDRNQRKKVIRIMLDGLKYSKIRELEIYSLSGLREEERKFYYQKIIEILKINNSLKFGNFYHNDIGLYADDMNFLSEGLKNNYSIKNINLSYNIIGNSPENMKYLAEGLKFNNSLIQIDLSVNHIGSHPDDIKLFSEAIANNFSLVIINLSFNRIGSNPDDMKFLGEGLKQNRSLHEIDLNWNNIGSFPNDLKLLTEGLKHNQNLKIIKIKSNNFLFDPNKIDYILDVKNFNKIIRIDY